MKAPEILSGMLVGLALLGCRHSPPGETGESSVVMVEPRRPPPSQGSSADAGEPVSRTDYRDARARHPLVMPIYPQKALAAGAGAAQVGVRVTVDASGVVTDIQPSMLVISITPPKFANDFREAVEMAVRQWRFHPARVHTMERVNEEGVTYDRVTRTELIEAQFDLAFTFTTAGKVEAK